MRSLSILFGSTLISLIASPQPQTSLNSGATVLFVAGVEAKSILATRDDFVQRMSPFDRAARMKTGNAVSEKEFLEFAGSNVLEWDDAEKQKVTSALLEIQKQPFSLRLPGKVFIVKTTGNEEGKASYTRANAIILPKAEIDMPMEKLQKTLCHELFLILSRAKPALREKLYASIGFREM
jgi:hypothetical protein